MEAGVMKAASLDDVTMSDDDDKQGMEMGRRVSLPVRATDHEDCDGADCFGRLLCEGNHQSSLCCRIQVTAEVPTLQNALEQFDLMAIKQAPLRIHCIDFDQYIITGEFAYLDLGKPRSSLSRSLGQRVAKGYGVSARDNITQSVKDDLATMCSQTAGTVLTWSGMTTTTGGCLLANVLADLDSTSTDQGLGDKLTTIATPPWSALFQDVQHKLISKGKGGVEDSGEEELFQTTRGLGDDVSTSSSHYIFLDHGPLNEDQNSYIEDEDSLRMDNTHYERTALFHCSLLTALDECVEDEDKDVPVVCILMEGYHNALKVVVCALRRNIPVLIVRDSGGIADIIIEIYDSAKRESRKERHESGRVYTRIRKVGAKVNGEVHPELKEVVDNLDLLTIYNPLTQSLDSAIFIALLKHKDEKKIERLLKMMLQRKRTLRRAPVAGGSFFESHELQMDYFVEALKQNSQHVVFTFLEHLNIARDFNKHFHTGRILQLYKEYMETPVTMAKVRKRQEKLLKKMTVFPLRCVGTQCQTCCLHPIDNNTPEEEAKKHRSCLDPVQELFLWCLQSQFTYLAGIFWQMCEDKMAAALVAQKLFQSSAEREDDLDLKWQMSENENRYQRLAINTLKSCHHMDEVQTEVLLTKPCPWWGNLSVLQLAIMTDNREFMTQTACKDVMTRVWKGQPPRNAIPGKKRPCSVVIPSAARDTRRCFGNWRCPPRYKYGLNCLSQVAFLLLFTYVLLADMGKGLTPFFWVLIVWMASITVEEGRQLLATDFVLCKNVTLLESNGCTLPALKRKCRAYWSEHWNKVDVVTIVLFWLGLVVLSPHAPLRDAGRVLLSLDIFFFFVRIFHSLMVFDELGLMLVMVFRMANDTRNFMIILLIFVLAYAVASESLLYPDSVLTWQRIFSLPRKGFWQVFGELFLEEIEHTDISSCSLGNDSKHYGGDTPHCPSSFGRYVAPVLLGGHIMITNVLLLNLLIARFGVTFAQVLDEAGEYQSWHRCQIITEYYSRKTVPPPLNLSHLLLFLFRAIFTLLERCCILLCRCCCRKRKQPSAASKREDSPMDVRFQNRPSHKNPEEMAKNVQESSDEPGRNTSAQPGTTGTVPKETVSASEAQSIDFTRKMSDSSNKQEDSSGESDDEIKEGDVSETVPLNPLKKQSKEREQAVIQEDSSRESDDEIKEENVSETVPLNPLKKRSKEREQAVSQGDSSRESDDKIKEGDVSETMPLNPLKKRNKEKEEAVIQETKGSESKDGGHTEESSESRKQQDRHSSEGVTGNKEDEHNSNEDKKTSTEDEDEQKSGEDEKKSIQSQNRKSNADGKKSNEDDTNSSKDEKQSNESEKKSTKDEEKSENRKSNADGKKSNEDDTNSSEDEKQGNESEKKSTKDEEKSENRKSNADGKKSNESEKKSTKDEGSISSLSTGISGTKGCVTVSQQQGAGAKELTAKKHSCQTVACIVEPTCAIRRFEETQVKWVLTHEEDGDMVATQLQRLTEEWQTTSTELQRNRAEAKQIKAQVEEMKGSLWLLSSQQQQLQQSSQELQQLLVEQQQQQTQLLSQQLTAFSVQNQQLQEQVMLSNSQQHQQFQNVLQEQTRINTEHQRQMQTVLQEKMEQQQQSMQSWLQEQMKACLQRQQEQLQGWVKEQKEQSSTCPDPPPVFESGDGMG